MSDNMFSVRTKLFTNLLYIYTEMYFIKPFNIAC